MLDRFPYEEVKINNLHLYKQNFIRFFLLLQPPELAIESIVGENFRDKTSRCLKNKTIEFTYLTFLLSR
jgi:hypothetical protein